MPSNGAFWPSVPPLPCMAILILTIIIPLYPRRSLGAATNPLGKKETRFWSLGLSFGWRSTLLPRQTSEAWHCAPSPSPARKGHAAYLRPLGGRAHRACWGPSRASNTQTPHPASLPHQHVMLSTAQLVKGEDGP